MVERDGVTVVPAASNENVFPDSIAVFQPGIFPGPS